MAILDLSEEQWKEINKMSFSRRFSEADRSVLGVAYILKAAILTNEKLMRRKATQWKLEVHGILWLLDCFVEKDLLSPQTATKKLEHLMETILSAVTSSLSENSLTPLYASLRQLSAAAQRPKMARRDGPVGFNLACYRSPAGLSAFCDIPFWL